LPQDTAI
jgi:hypothetical protein